MKAGWFSDATGQAIGHFWRRLVGARRRPNSPGDVGGAGDEVVSVAGVVRVGWLVSWVSAVSVSSAGMP